MPETIVTYFGQPMKVGCDGRCEKAWGINNRPRVQLSDNEDDYEFLADDEFGIAPADPGTYEGGHAKPADASEFPNKWCVRECERAARSRIGEWMLSLELPDYSVRRRNIIVEGNRPMPEPLHLDAIEKRNEIRKSYHGLTSPCAEADEYNDDVDALLAECRRLRVELAKIAELGD